MNERLAKLEETLGRMMGDWERTRREEEEERMRMRKSLKEAQAAKARRGWFGFASAAFDR